MTSGTTSGICFTADDDAKLARGWPNLVVPVDGHKADKSPAKSAMNALRVGDPIYFTEWPRETLHRYLRGTIINGAPKNGNDVTLFDVPGPLSADEALAGLRKVVVTDDFTYPFRFREIAWGIESIAGTDETIRTIVDALKDYKPRKNAWATTSIVTTLPFMFLRASPSVVKEARAALAPIAAALAPTSATATRFDTYQDALDVALHGASAVPKTMGKFVYLEVPALYGIAALEAAGDDPDMVRGFVPKADKKAPMSVRIAAIAGTEVLADLSLRRFPAAKMASMARDFGMIRSPEIVRFMLSLVGKSSVKDAPLAWFKSHADYCKPILASIKTDAAKSISKMI